MVINKLVKKKVHLQLLRGLTNPFLLHCLHSPAAHDWRAKFDTLTICFPSEVATSRSEHLFATLIVSLYQEGCFANEVHETEAAFS